jgi:uncharacterized tellurite resistance protein B-like protein
MHRILEIISDLLVGWFYKKTAGYGALTDDDARINNLAVALGFAASACDGQMSEEEIHTIESWAKTNITTSNDTREFHKAMTATKAFFHAGNNIDCSGICREITVKSALAHRYRIIELCMKVVSADGIAKASELEFLRNLFIWLELNHTTVAMMMETFVPVNIQETPDAEFILGLDESMSEKDRYEKLNREYKKWNGRVTNNDHSIRIQAKKMIELISSLRNNSTANIAQRI